MIPNALPPEEMLRRLIQTTRAQALWHLRLSRGANELLDQVVKHTIQTVPFYQHWSLGQGSKDCSFQKLPIISKEDIRKKPDSFYSSLFEPEILEWRTTSGSTGEPISICFDPASLYGDIFDIYRDIARFVRPILSEACPGETAMVIVNDNPIRQPSSTINPELRHGLVHLVVLGKNDVDDETLVNHLRETDIPVLSGRPRSLLRLLELDECIPSSGKTIMAKSILTSGDNLHDDVRRRLQSWFRSPVHNAYASQEGGVIGVECKHKVGIHVFSNRALIEVLNQEGNLVREGTGELVVTNFTNWAMPFLRYRTGDIATVESIDCACGFCGPTITKLSGRDSVYFFFKRRRFNPSLLNEIFEALPIRQFQVIQEPDYSLNVRWIPSSGEDDHHSIELVMREGFRRLLGDVRVEFQCVTEIGSHGRKVQRYVRQTTNEALSTAS